MSTGAPFRTFVSVPDLARGRDESWVVIDARFDLTDSRAGLDAYRAGHLPGAVYAHLDEDLSGPRIPGETGRRPLPSPDDLASALRTWGASPGTQVVVYDDRSGSMAAARLWVLLRWLGHEDVAVLDGGFPAWLRAGLPISRALPGPRAGTLQPHLRPEWVAETPDVTAAMTQASTVLIDARPADVYRGTGSSLDRVPGHIPGARCLPVAVIEGEHGQLASRETLRLRYSSLGALDPGTRSRIAYCGSGVWAAQHVLALTHLGVPNARLYVGSFSEWLVDEDRPAQTS